MALKNSNMSKLLGNSQGIFLTNFLFLLSVQLNNVLKFIDNKKAVIDDKFCIEYNIYCIIDAA